MQVGEPSHAEVGANASNMDLIMRIPVTVQIVLGTATMPVANLAKLGRGAVVPLDRRVGEPVDVVVNGKVVARGEVVVDRRGQFPLRHLADRSPRQFRFLSRHAVPSRPNLSQGNVCVSFRLR